MTNSFGSKGLLPNWLFTALRFFIIIAFVLFAGCSFAFYAAPTMTFMGEKGETVYELAKMEEPFAENLLTFAYINIGVAVVVAALFILPQTANRKYYAVWLHEVVAAVSTVLYVSVLIQVCKGMDFVKEWEMETGAGLILPLVFIIIALTVNVFGVFLWRFFGGERALAEDAQNYIAATVLPPKPTKEDKPLARMPESIRKCTKLYKKKCFYTIAMWSIIFWLMIVASQGFLWFMSIQDLQEDDFIFDLVDSYEDVKMGVCYAILLASLGSTFYGMFYILVITALVQRLRKQRKVWNFKRGNAWYVVGQLVFFALSLVLIGCNVFLLGQTQSGIDEVKNAPAMLGILFFDKTDIVICASVMAAVVVLFMLFRMILQIRISKVKKQGDFTGDVAFYESNFKAYGKQYRADLWEYRYKTYRYHRLKTVLE